MVTNPDPEVLGPFSLLMSRFCFPRQTAHPSSVEYRKNSNRRHMCLDVGISLPSYARGKHPKLSPQLRQNKRNIRGALLGEVTPTS